MEYLDLTLKEKIKYYKNGFIDLGYAIIYKKLPDELTKNYIDGGEYGVIFKVNDQYAFKFAPCNDYPLMKKLQNIQVDGFTFPIKMVFEKNSFEGFLITFVNGHKLSKGISYLRTIIFLKELIRFEYNIKDLSDKRVLASDIYGDNIMIDVNGKIWGVDTDFYLTNCSYDTYKSNIKEFSKQLLEQIICIDNVKDRLLRFKNDKLTDSCIMTCEGELKPSELLKLILYEIECTSNQTETINDVQSSMKLILR